MFVHYSTDYVFDGSKPGAYTEGDEPGPLNIYGASKLAGERAVAAGGGRSWCCAQGKYPPADRLLRNEGFSKLIEAAFRFPERRFHWAEAALTSERDGSGAQPASAAESF
jgi:hypothetical protein